MQRRNFFKLVGAASAVAMLPKFSYGATPPNIVVVGGGPGGAAAAKYLKIWGGSSVNVILITPTNSYIAGMQSNLVVTGALNPATITRNYNSLRTRGVKTRYAKVTGITIGSSGGTVTFTDSNLPNPNPDNLPNGHIDYDYLVLAPGVKFSHYKGDDNFELSYWQRDQTTAQAEFLDLKKKIATMPSGSTFAMYVPDGTYKGSQGPFGRACVVADQRPDCIVKVYDGKASLPPLFEGPFASLGIKYYKNTILDSVVKKANPTGLFNQSGTININAGTSVDYHVANLIPKQKANLDFAPPNLLAANGFAPVDSQTFHSSVLQPGYDRVYVIGDASVVPLPTLPASNLPKSGNLAADQAKICASAITRRIAGLATYPLETSLAVSAVQFNAIRSTNAHTAVYAHSGFQFNGTGWVASGAFPDARVSASGALPASSENYSQGLTWVKSLLDDCFI